MVGMISTHWRQPYEPGERDLRLLDILARQAADLIERSQAAEAIRQNQEALREADRRKDEFLATLAHELRNPLAPIRTGLELIRLAGDTPTAVQRVRAIMERQVTHMVRLIDDLLDVSRITSGKIQLRRERTALEVLVGSAIEANRAAITAKQIDLRVSLPDAACVLDVDPTRFIQVVSNLLDNAAKFTDRGGSIDVSVQMSDAGAGELVLSVKDTGIGISPELLPRVFDPFMQGDRGSAQPGLGLGLALARRLVEMHGGHIDVHSDGQGRGSEFVVRLPVSDWQT
jgi:signal transduction histidine kinase